MLLSARVDGGMEFHKIGPPVTDCVDSFASSLQCCLPLIIRMRLDLLNVYKILTKLLY